jgi:hypothetical protein
MSARRDVLEVIPISYFYQSSRAKAVATDRTASLATRGSVRRLGARRRAPTGR